MYSRFNSTPKADGSQNFIHHRLPKTAEPQPEASISYWIERIYPIFIKSIDTYPDGNDSALKHQKSPIGFLAVYRKGTNFFPTQNNPKLHKSERKPYPNQIKIWLPFSSPPGKPRDLVVRRILPFGRRSLPG